MNRGYKFRIYPSAEQRIMFAKTFGCVRFVYNRMLSDKLEKKKSVTPAQYKDEFEWLREVDSLALCNAQMNLKRAFENRRKNPKHFGKPHFKSKKSRQSYSTNNQKDYPKYYRRAQKRLRRVQKKFSRSKKFSNNREKIRVMLSRVYEKVTNRRKDFLHKLSSRLVNENDAIVIEDLDLQAMSKQKRGGRFSFGKSISDNGWSMFTRMLEYELDWQDKILVKIDKWYPSSQICSQCGYQNSSTKNLSVRQWICPKCGAHHDRDVNAAINIKTEGIRILA